MVTKAIITSYSIHYTKLYDGITWGLCHFTDIGPRDKRYSVIARFDCDLSLDKDDHWMKDPEHYWPPEFYYYTGLGADAKEQLKQEARQDLKKR